MVHSFNTAALCAQRCRRTRCVVTWIGGCDFHTIVRASSQRGKPAWRRVATGRRAVRAGRRWMRACKQGSGSVSFWRLNADVGSAGTRCALLIVPTLANTNWWHCMGAACRNWHLRATEPTRYWRVNTAGAISRAHILSIAHCALGPLHQGSPAETAAVFELRVV